MAIIKASQENRLPELLGAVDGGMGAPDKTKLSGQPIAVTAKAPNGTAAQTSVTDQPDLKRTVQQTKKVTPPGGSVEIEDPAKEARSRIRSRNTGQWWNRSRPADRIAR